LLHAADRFLQDDNPQQGKVRVSDLMETTLKRYDIDALKSTDDARARWKLHLKPEFEHLGAANVSSDMLDSYVQKRLKEDAEPATVNRELALLKRGFSLGMQSTPPKVRFMPHFPHLIRRQRHTIPRWAGCAVHYLLYLVHLSAALHSQRRCLGRNHASASSR
jgi:hypothetical protein